MGDLTMKDKFISSLKRIKGGNFNGAFTVFLVLFMILLLLSFMALIPLTLIWGLQLLGFGVQLSTNSFIGALLIYFFLYTTRFGTTKSKE